MERGATTELRCNRRASSVVSDNPVFKSITTVPEYPGGRFTLGTSGRSRTEAADLSSLTNLRVVASAVRRPDGAAKFSLKTVDMPIRYGELLYGETKMQRWRIGWLPLRMVFLHSCPN